ncbi:divalent cation tolerance protein CutA, partial [Staphylococcus aureus]|nr:divalent cation tolerance protein CutA [Staphylococcus aureus]
MAGAALIWCPFPDPAAAEAVAGTLLDAGLVACANILPAMRSLYVWQGERHADSEVGVLFKT